MALVEINLKKPALLEEIVDEAEADESASSPSGRMTRQTGDSGGAGAMARKVGMVGFVLALLGVARAVRSRRSSSSSSEESNVVEVQVEGEGESSEQTSGKSNRRVLGMVLFVVGAVAAARLLRGARSS